MIRVRVRVRVRVISSQLAQNREGDALTPAMHRWGEPWSMLPCLM